MYRETGGRPLRIRRCKASHSCDGQPFTVVEFMPPKFKFPGMTGVLFGVFWTQPPDVWVALVLDGEARQVRGIRNWQFVARLKPGLTPILRRITAIAMII